MVRGKRSVGAATLALAWLASLAAVPAWAQSPRGAQVVYTNRAAFSLPVKMEDRDRAELKELKFYVKSPSGPKPGQWALVETAPPTKSRFSFQAAYDGEYQFAFVTVDKAGQVAPANLEKATPGLIVVVDTHAPEIDVQRLPVPSGEVFVQCQIKDANPDYTTLRLEYQTPERGWRALDAQADAPGVFKVADPSILRGMFRTTAADKAGNKLVREVSMNKDSSATTVASKAPSSGVEGPILPASVTSAVTRTVEKPVADQQSTEEPPTAPRQLLNSLHCRMEYSLDTPNVSKVEGYATRDGGKTWMRLGEDADRRSPYEFDLPEDGVYGISLVVSAGSRTAGPPATGDTPDWFVEIDTTRPVVVVHETRRGTGDDSGHVTLNWSVQDKNLGTESVELLWATQPDGPWQTALRGLKAEGNARWSLPTDVTGHIHLRLEATDKAGNVGRWELREPLEMAKPKAKVLGVTAGK